MLRAERASGRYFLVDWDCCLGAGSEGEVYLGRSFESGELCAVKISCFLDSEAQIEQLRAELDKSTRAAGEGVVRVLAWNLQPPRPFLVFELADGGSLSDEIRGMRDAGRTHHPVTALERCRDVLRAIARVHRRGLVHRDIKPANLLRVDGAMKVTDFGCGFTLDRDDGTGEVVGTRLYASPEQLEGERVDERADLFAAGCILHEMITGHLPRRGEATTSALRYPNALVLPELDSLLRDLLAPSPEDRPSNAEVAIERVNEVLTAYAHARELWSGLGLGASPY